MNFPKISIKKGDLVKIADNNEKPTSPDGHIYRVDYVLDGIVYATSTTNSNRGIARNEYILTWA